MDNGCSLVKNACSLHYNFLRYAITQSLDIFCFPVPRSWVCLVLQSSVECDGGDPFSCLLIQWDKEDIRWHRHHWLPAHKTFTTSLFSFYSKRNHSLWTEIHLYCIFNSTKGTWHPQSFRVFTEVTHFSKAPPTTVAAFNGPLQEKSSNGLQLCHTKNLVFWLKIRRAAAPLVAEGIAESQARGQDS